MFVSYYNLQSRPCVQAPCHAVFGWLVSPSCRYTARNKPRCSFRAGLDTVMAKRNIQPLPGIERLQSSQQSVSLLRKLFGHMF